MQLDAKNITAAGKLRLLTLDHLDGRTAAAKRARDLVDAIEADLGGADRLSEGERQLVQRAALLGALLADVKFRWVGGEPIDTTAYCTVINAQRRVLETIGLHRRALDVTAPTLADIVDEIDAGKEHAA